MILLDKEAKACPPWISKLRRNQIFVFGSNESGIHGAGAAALAHDKWGATWGQGFGPSGLTFAIPSKDWQINTMEVLSIAPYVNRFVQYAITHPDLEFLVTEIGCGLAGYQAEDIAPLFESTLDVGNIKLPMTFLQVLGDKNNEE